MYFLVKKKIRVPVRPSEIRPDVDMDEIILRILRNELEGSVQERFGYIVAVIDAKADDIGDILYGSPNVYFNVQTTLLVYRPLEGEITEGEIVDVTQQAIYVNLGCIDAFLPVHNLWNDRFRFDATEKTLRGTKTKITIQKGDLIRAKITETKYRVPEIVGPLVRGTIVKPAVEVRPKSEVRVTLRAKETGLGLLKVLEQMREEMLKTVSRK